MHLRAQQNQIHLCCFYLQKRSSVIQSWWTSYNAISSMEVIQEQKIVKKPRRSRQVCEDQTKEYLRRPIQKIENLTQNLMNSYEKGTSLRSKSKNLEQTENPKTQQQKSSQMNQQQNKQSIYHQSNSQKPNQIVQREKKVMPAEIEESSITTSSHQEVQRQQNVSKQSSQRSSDRKKQYKINDKSSSQNSEQQQQSKKRKQDKDYIPQESDEKQNNASAIEQSSQMSYKRRRRTQAQMLLAHKIQVLKSFLNKKKYIRKKLRPKKLVGPPLSQQEEWKIDLQKYHKLKQLIKQQMDERKQMMQKIEGFGEQQHLKTIKIEEEILSGKRARGQRSDDNSQNNSRSSSSSSSSSSGNSLSSSKSNNKIKLKQTEEKKQSIDKSKEKQTENNNEEEDSAEEICKGTEKEISFFKKLVDENLDSLKPKPDRRRRRRRKFTSNHKQYINPKRRNRNQRSKEQSVKKQEKVIKTQSENIMKPKIKLQTQNKEKIKEQKNNEGSKSEKSNKKIQLPPKIHHLRQRRLLQEQKRKVQAHNSQSQPLSQQKRDRLKPKIFNKNTPKNLAEGDSSANRIAFIENNSESIITANPPQITNQLKQTSNLYAKKSTKFKHETKELEMVQKGHRSPPQKIRQEYYAQFISDKKKSIAIHSRLVLESMLFRIDKQPNLYSIENTQERSNEREKSHRSKKKKYMKEVCTESQSQSKELDYRNRHKAYDYQPKYSRKNKKYRKIIEEYTDSEQDYPPEPKVYRKVKRPHKSKKDVTQLDVNEHTDQQQEKTFVKEKKRRLKSQNNQG